MLHTIFPNHPLKYKRDFRTIRNLVDRATLLSDTWFHKKNIDTVKNVLLNNYFSSHMINTYD